MDITEIETMLTAETIDKEAVLAAVKTLNDEKTLAYKNKDREALALKADFKKLGYTKEDFADRETFVTHINELKTKTQSDSEAKTKVTLLETQLQEFKNKEIAWKKAETSKTLEKALNEKLSGKLKGHEAIIDNLILRDQVKVIDNDVVFMDNDTPTTLDAGIAKLMTKYADLVIADQNPGANTKNKPTSNNVSNITLDSIKKMTPEQIKANLSDIKKLAGSRPGIR